MRAPSPSRTSRAPPGVVARTFEMRSARSARPIVAAMRTPSAARPTARERMAASGPAGVPAVCASDLRTEATSTGSPSARSTRACPDTVGRAPASNVPVNDACCNRFAPTSSDGLVNLTCPFKAPTGPANRVEMATRSAENALPVTSALSTLTIPSSRSNALGVVSANCAVLLDEVTPPHRQATLFAAPSSATAR